MTIYLEKKHEADLWKINELLNDKYVLSLPLVHSNVTSCNIKLKEHRF